MSGPAGRAGSGTLGIDRYDRYDRDHLRLHVIEAVSLAERVIVLDEEGRGER